MDVVSGSTNPAVSLATALYDVRSLADDATWMVDGIYEQLASPEEYPAVPFDARQIELMARLHRALRIIAGCEYAPGGVGEVAADVMRLRMSAMVEPEVFDSTPDGRPTAGQCNGGAAAFREHADQQLALLRRLPSIVTDAAMASVLTGEARAGTPAWTVAMCAEMEQLRNRLQVLENQHAAYGAAQSSQGIEYGAIGHATRPARGQSAIGMTDWRSDGGIFGSGTP